MLLGCYKSFRLLQLLMCTLNFVMSFVFPMRPSLRLQALLFNISNLIFFLVNSKTSLQVFGWKLSNNYYEFDWWEDNVSNDFLIFIDFLMWCSHNVFVGNYFWNSPIRHSPYFLRPSKNIQIWKLFSHSTIASHSWTFRKAKRHTQLSNLANINYILESSKNKKATAIFRKKKIIYILEYRYQL